MKIYKFTDLVDCLRSIGLEYKEHHIYNSLDYFIFETTEEASLARRNIKAKNAVFMSIKDYQAIVSRK